MSSEKYHRIRRGHFLSFLVIFHVLSMAKGHGRLVEPPSRSSMWRFGFPTKPNYNDNELFCGGYTVQWQRNGGKCGLCGDSFDSPRPRANEAGGIYGRGIIVRTYKPGEVIDAVVDITANHKGFFEFKLCPHNDPSTDPPQECLDRYPLQLADGSGSKYYPSPGTGPFSVQLRLPRQLTCTQCIFQWTYTAGNNWGRCENGTSSVGCGPQETFRGCADVSIGSGGGGPPSPPAKRPRPAFTIPPTRRTTPARSRPTRPYRTRRPTAKISTRIPTYTRRPPARRPPTRWPTDYNNYPRRKYSSVTTASTTPFPRRRPTPRRSYPKNPSTKKPSPTYKPKPFSSKPGTSKVHCEAVGVWRTVSGMANWCVLNCARGYCPPTHCDCRSR